jgi:hypothetical protein
LIRPIQWGSVARVQLGGESLDGQQARERFTEGDLPGASEELPEPSPAPSKPLPPRPSDADDDHAGRAASEEAPLPIRGLAIDASVGKWQNTVESDGVLVRVYPMDAYGSIVPVSGTLEIDVIGEQHAGRTYGEPFPPLIRWATKVRPEDVGPNGATYRVPFQAWHPEFDLKLGSMGAVHARLSVPGQGVFDDTATMVWLRPLNTTRDRLQRFSGGRFFPEERTNRGMNDSGFPH